MGHPAGPFAIPGFFNLVSVLRQLLDLLLHRRKLRLQLADVVTRDGLRPGLRNLDRTLHSDGAGRRRLLTLLQAAVHRNAEGVPDSERLLEHLHILASLLLIGLEGRGGIGEGVGELGAELLLLLGQRIELEL